MQDPTMFAALASTGLAGFGLVSATALKGWREWLDVRRLEIDRGGARRAGPAGSPIELRTLRERVRRLEAIANGADPSRSG